MGRARVSIRAGSWRRFDGVLPDDAIVTTDAGNFAGWAGRGFRFRRPGTFLGPTSGAMGYGLPAAIAAVLVHRDRAVVALTGDGGLAMTLAELETAVREHARVVVLVFDNQRYGTIRMWQDRRGTGIGVATELGPVDFAAIGARSAHGRAGRPDAEFEPALRAALAADRPTVIQLALDRPGSRSTSRRADSLAAPGRSRPLPGAPADDRERQRNPAALVRPDVVVAVPPVDRVLGDPLEAQPGPQEGGHDLTERPGTGELPGSARRRGSTAGRCTRAPSPVEASGPAK